MIRSLLMALLLLATPATAQQIDKSVSGRAVVSGNTRPTEGAVVELDWEVQVRLGLLMDEPVLSLYLKFEQPDFAWPTNTVTLPVLTRAGQRYIPVRLSQLPEKVSSRFRLMNVKMRLTFRSNAQRALFYAIGDVGITGLEGEWSFNVPGSPDWDELFRRDANREIYYDEQTARQLYENDLTLVRAEVYSAELNLHDLHATYLRNYEAREQYRVLGEAYDRLLDGLQRSYGIDASNIENGWRPDLFTAEEQEPLSDPNTWFKTHRDFRETLSKLAELPDALRSGDNHEPYEEAVRQYREISFAATNAAYNFAADGVDPDTIQKGEAPVFGGVYEERVIDDERWLVARAPEERKIRTMHSEEYLIGGAFLLSGRSVRAAECSAGTLQIGLEEPENGEHISSLTMPCFVEGQTAFIGEHSDSDDTGHPYVEIRVTERPPRKFTRNVTCRICGRDRQRSGTASEYYTAYYAVKPDLNVFKLKSESNISSNICPTLVFCRD